MNGCKNPCIAVILSPDDMILMSSGFPLNIVMAFQGAMVPSCETNLQ